MVVSGLSLLTMLTFFLVAVGCGCGNYHCATRRTKKKTPNGTESVSGSPRLKMKKCTKKTVMLTPKELQV